MRVSTRQRTEALGEEGVICLRTCGVQRNTGVPLLTTHPDIPRAPTPHCTRCNHSIHAEAYGQSESHMRVSTRQRTDSREMSSTWQ
jgi:hypothetical protein